MTKFLATWFYSGLAPKAPGTFGSLAALPFAYFLYNFGGWLFLTTASFIVFLIGWWATAKEIQNKENHDPSEIVIDEVVGQWIALIPLAYLSESFTEKTLALSFLAFGLFRFFDILKPFPVSWADKMDTALGVMLDDVIAGIMAALIITIILLLIL